jgi:dihydrofolate reductase
VLTYYSLEEALAKAKELDAEDIYIGGGAQIYEQALPYVDRLYLTLVEDEKEADSFFPSYEHLFTKKLSEEAREHEGLVYRWVDLEK